MSGTNIHERVLSAVDHNTNNYYQGETVKRAVIVQLLSRSEYDPGEVQRAIATLVENGDLEATGDGRLRLA